MTRILIALLLIGALLAGGWWLAQRTNVYDVETPITASPADCPGDVHFAVIGDYGVDKPAEAAVAALVHSWNPDFIVSLGDNNYPAGAAETIDANVGKHYADFIAPYVGDYGPGAEENRFFPILGNHDLNTDLGQAYFDYFELPGNERYYDLRKGPVHLFFLNSDVREPDGHTATSAQAAWLQEQLSASDATWKLVIMHHTPYTSYVLREADRDLRWPFTEWGATAVLSGHDHFYERLLVNGIPYFINGAGGGDLYRIGQGVSSSVVRYNRGHGAMQVQAGDACINFSFYNDAGELIDSYTQRP